ncbi:MAG: hypothetical protein DMNBKLKJ_00297 [Candidatus Westeberhardia cardiocondylae]|nr:hypothetical protein [Candidatus Westeberhardia cardiocondylae]
MKKNIINYTQIKFFFIYYKKIIKILLLFIIICNIYIYHKHQKNHENNIQQSILWENMYYKFKKNKILQISKFDKNCYNTFSKFLLANYYIYCKKYFHSKQILYNILKNTKDPILQSIIKINIAKIQLQKKNTKNTKKILQSISNKEFNPLINNILGDIENNINKNKKFAKYYYKQALNSNKSKILKILLQMKIDTLYN